MLSKRFLSTAAPLAFLALAGMGLATAQSSSPFASKKQSQAWEQPTQAAPQSYASPLSRSVYREQGAPSSAPSSATTYAPTAAPQPARTQPLRSQPAPSQAIPSADTPIVTAPVPAAPAYQSFSTANAPKTYSGQSAAPAGSYGRAYGAAPNLAGSATPPPAGSAYSYRAPQPTRVAQAPDFGTPARQPAAPQGSSVPPQTRPPVQTQSSGSPFAPNSGARRPQAWEVPQPQAQNPQYQAPQYQAPQYNNGQYAPNSQVPNTQVPNNQVPNYQNPNYQNPAYQNPAYQSSTPPTGIPPQGVPRGGPFTPQPPKKRSLKERLGLGNIATLLRGAFTGGAAVSFRDTPDSDFGAQDGTSEDFIGDAELELEVSAITRSGLEYGFTLGGRAQYDPFRRGFGGRIPDCPPTVAGCSGQAFASATGLRGHTSGFYSSGEDVAEDFQADIESAHLFLRSAYGDVTIGRDDGAAYLFSLGAPSLLAVGASNSPVDYTGFDSVKTVNDASGYSEKVTYTSPRLLGDQIGVGIQFGASYALDADVCGVDYCNGLNIDGVTQAEIEDVFEVGVALDRTFQNGLGVELTGTYARGSETSGLAGLDDLDSFGAGLEFTYKDWTLGSSYLQSNNGLIDGDYTAYDAGVTWQPGSLGFTLGYGHAEDDNIGLTSDQATFGITYDFNKFTLGTGVQYVDRELNGIDEIGIPTTIDQRAASVFIQGGFKF